MVLTVYSLLWVMQDFGHQPYGPKYCFGGFPITPTISNVCAQDCCFSLLQKIVAYVALPALPLSRHVPNLEAKGDFLF